MSNEKNNYGIIIGLLITIIVILIGFIILLLTNTISFNTKSDNITENNNDITENNQESEQITNEEALIIVNEIMDKFYNEVFYGHKETYCGEYDKTDTIDYQLYNYYKSASYTDLESLKSHLNTYMTNNLIEYMLGGNDAPKYIEQNGNLYCLVIPRGALSYDKTNSSYTIIGTTTSTIIATGNISAKAEGNVQNTITVSIGIDKVNDKWLLSTYEEKAN